MRTSELTTLVERAEHLLWVLARYDVERLTDRRSGVLRSLGELEQRAHQLGVTNLYEKILLEGPGLTRIVL